MDLYQFWQDLSEKKFSQPTLKKEEIMQAIHKESNSTISKLKKRLKFKLYWIIFFIALFSIWMLFSLGNLELLSLISFFNAVYIFGLLTLGYQYRKMNNELPYDGSTLSLMKRNAKLIKKALRIETISGLFLMPTAVVGGILVSNLYNGYTIAETLQNQHLLITTLGFLIVVVPLLSWLSSKMNAYAFGQYIHELEANIAKMEELV